MLYTTPALAIRHHACDTGIKEILNAWGYSFVDTRVPLKFIAKQNFEHALWCLRCTTEDSSKIARLFACECAELFHPECSPYLGNIIKLARKVACEEASLAALRWAGRQLATVCIPGPLKAIEGKEVAMDLALPFISINVWNIYHSTLVFSEATTQNHEALKAAFLKLLEN